MEYIGENILKIDKYLMHLIFWLLAFPPLMISNFVISSTNETACLSMSMLLAVVIVVVVVVVL